jgi:hypothetical protein
LVFNLGLTTEFWLRLAVVEFVNERGLNMLLPFLVKVEELRLFKVEELRLFKVEPVLVV